jgi:hypothetical protein
MFSKEATEMRRKIAWMLIAVMAATTAIEMSDHYAATGKLGIARPAEAVVGRPLTPVSVAGVARRTIRRCAVGVYNC